MQEIKFVDTTIRDGQASLWAMNMRTKHMLAAMPYIDQAGFESMEFIATGSRLKKFIRHLNENPWDWIKGGASAAKNTPLRWHGSISGRTMSGYVPKDVGELLISKAVELGIKLTRTGNNWNDYESLRPNILRLDELGMSSVVNVIYSVSPRHTDEYYVQKAKEAASLNPYRLCFKDVGGLLTPERIKVLVPKMTAATPGVTWEFHGHCNNSFGPINALECAKLGIGIIHTAIPPLANANSQPSIYNVAGNLRELGFNTSIDEEALRPASDYFTFIAKKEKYQIGTPYEYSERLYRHQVPGGMISNLQFQLAQAGVAERIEEVLEEIPAVRADFGYPIMVTPLSQIVGTQAAINVIVGERYLQVTDQTIEYALGRHGKSAPSVMNQDIRDKILGRPRATELEKLEPWEPTISELRQRYGENISDEDLIIMSIVGDDALDVVGSAAKKSVSYVKATPLTELIHELAFNANHRYISVQKGDISIKMVKTTAPKNTV